MRLFLGLAIGLLWTAATSADIGSVKVARGVVTAQSANGVARLLSPGAKLEEGDVLSTATRSYAVIEMGDGARMTVRPRSVLALEEYKFEKQESAVLRLFRGGLRAITGFISKRNRNAFKIRTPVATIGIRGTAFEARLCDAQCAKERRNKSRKGASRAQAGPPVVARVVFLRGAVQADRGAGRARPMTLGASLYEGDVVTTAGRSLAVLSLKDGSRVTVVPNSTFKIEQLSYSEAEPEKDSMFLRLLRGGLRAVSGIIGKRNQSRMRLSAGSATIGIRGTGFDLACDGVCGDAEQTAQIELTPMQRHLAAVLNGIVPMAHAQAAGGRIYVHFFSGSGTLTSGGRTIDVPTGGIGLVPGQGLLPQAFSGQLPPVLQQLQSAPNPANEDSVDPEIKDQLDELFDLGLSEDLGEGTLIVLVDEGDVSVGGVFLGEGEGAVTGGAQGAVPVRVLNQNVQVIRLPPPNVLEANSALLEGLGNSMTVEFNDNGQMCIGF